MTIQEALSKIIEGFHGIGNFASIVLTLIAFWGVISKKPKEKLKQTIMDTAKEANKDINEKVNQIDEKIQISDKTDLAIIRNTITHIYFKYKDTKKIPHYEKENLISLYDQYERLGGNSYVKGIMAEMQNWEEIV